MRVLRDLAQLHASNARLRRQVVDGHDAPPVPVASVSEHGVDIGFLDLPRSPRQLGRLSAPADDPFHPAQQGVGVATLRRHVDGHRPEPSLDDGPAQARRPGRGETSVLLVVPLHRRPHAHPALDREVLGHPDLLPVEQDRRPGQREQQAVAPSWNPLLDRPRASTGAFGGARGRRAASLRPARTPRRPPAAGGRSACRV